MDHPADTPTRSTKRLARRHLPAAVAIGAVLFGIFALMRWRQVSGDIVRDLLGAELARLSDSVYVLRVSPVRLRLFPGAISFDSLLVTSDSAHQAAHPNRPALRVWARGCQLSGVDLLALARKEGLHGKLFSCAEVDVGAAVSDTATPGRQPSKQRGKLDFLKLEREFHLPEALPIIAVKKVDFPDIRLDLTRREKNEPPQRVALRKFSAQFDDVLIDPRQPINARQPLFSKQVAIAAEELAVGSGDQKVSFQRMSADLDAQSFTLMGLQVEPSVPPAEWFKRQKYRRPWVKLVADSIRFAGLDFAQLIATGEVSAERAIVGGVDVTIETDASLPTAPHADALQQAATAATTGVRVEADTVMLIDGQVHYVGHLPGRPDNLVAIPRVALAAGQVFIDPNLPRRLQRPLLARVIWLELDSASWRTSDSLKQLMVREIRLGTRDSTLIARGVVAGPELGDATIIARQRDRHVIVRAGLDSVVMHGLDYDKLVLGSGINVRDLSFAGIRVRLLEDMSRPPPPPRKETARPAIDSVLADLGIHTNVGRFSALGDVHFIQLYKGLPRREFQVARLDLSGEDILVNGAEDSTTSRPILSQRLRLVLAGISRHWGERQSVRIGQVIANLHDSTLAIDSIRFQPPFSPTPVRTAVHLGLDGISLSGVNFVALADGHGVKVRKGVLANASVDIKVNAGVPAKPATPDPSARPDSGIGPKLPLALGDFQLLQGHVSFVEQRPGKTPVVVLVQHFTMGGHDVSLDDPGKRPLFLQDVTMHASGLTAIGGGATAAAREIDIHLADSTILVHGIEVRTPAERGDSMADKRGLHLLADSIGAAGVDLRLLSKAKGIRLRRMVLGGMNVEVRHAPAPKGPPVDSAATVTRTHILAQAKVPISIGQLLVPNATFRYVNTSSSGKVHVTSVHRASLDGEGITFDPSLPRKAQLPHLSRKMLLTADSIVLSDNPMNSFVIASLAASFTDSTLRLGRIAIGPRVSDSVWLSRQTERHTRIKVGADSVKLAGVDYDRFLEAEGLWLRHARVFAFDLDASDDKSLPANPVRTRHSTAQEDVQSIAFPFGIDTATVIDGTVTYREKHPDNPEPGVLTFTRIAATVTGFSNRGTLGTTPPLRISTHSLLWGAGALDVYAEAPLLAKGYDLTYHGHLGPMKATAINQFAEHALPVLIQSGQIKEVTFSVASVDGHATGNLVPIYDDLRVQIRDENAGFFKKVEYSVVSFIAKLFFIRHNNPPRPDEAPKVGIIDHTFDGETIISYLWIALRGGIEKAMVRK